MRVLDPACGSGNFLYVALKRLLDLEKEVQTFAATNGIPVTFPQVDPTAALRHRDQPLRPRAGLGRGLDRLYPVAARQRLRRARQPDPEAPAQYPPYGRDPGLRRRRQPVEPEWPEADVIIGNPPFLGGKKMRGELGDEYTEHLWRLFHGRFSGSG